MKNLNVWYWITTVIFGGMMAFSGIPNIMNNADSIKFVHDMLGYPLYFIPFIGVAKVAGSIALFIPGFNRVKEWAYAGLIFDLIAATYSFIALGNPFNTWYLMLVFIIIGFASYFLHHKRNAV